MIDLPCKRSQIEFVVWRDAVGQWTRGDLQAAADLQLAINTNVGWIVHECRDRIVLCNGTSSTGEMDYLIIPAGNVIRRQRVK